MRYKVYGREGFKALFSNKLALLIIVILLSIPLQVIYAAFTEPLEDILLGLVFTFFIMGPLVIFLGLTAFISGWEIKGDTLNLTIFAICTKLHIPTIEVGIINDAKWTDWDSTAISGGTHIPYLLSSGTLGNIKKGLNIVFFQHLGYKRFVVIHTTSQYYLIAHPGVEKLYDELLRLGATEKDFTSTFY